MIAEDPSLAKELLGNVEGPPEEFPQWAQGAWDAFFTLTPSRPVITSMRIIQGGVLIPDEREGRIPFVAIDGYAKRFCISDADFPDFLALVTSLDLEFMKIRAEERANGDGP